jgi:hypothetical protein
MVKYCESTLEDAEYLGARLRQSDIDEVTASTGKDPGIAIKEAFLRSCMCWTAFKNGKPAAIWGAASSSALSSFGSPWMLGSDELNRSAIEIGRASRYYVMRMKQRFAILENYVDARQTKSIRWLRWCGFTLENPEPYGVLGLNFHKFWME